VLSLSLIDRYLAGMKEYEVELQFTSGLLGYPDRIHDEHSAIDGNDPVYGDEDHKLLPEVSIVDDDASVHNSTSAKVRKGQWNVLIK